MRFPVFGALASIYILVSGAQSFAGSPPEEAFGNLPAVDTASLSPDGKHLAVIGMFNGAKKVEFIDLSKPDSQPFVTGMEGGLATDVVWKSNDTAIVSFHATLNYRHSKYLDAWSRAISVTPSTQRDVLLAYDAPFFRINTDGANVADLDDGDPNHVLMTQFDRWDREWTLDIYNVDLSTGRATLITHGDIKTASYVTDGYGHILGTLEQDSDLTDHVMLGNAEAYSYSARGGETFALKGMIENSGSQFVVELAGGDAGTSGLYVWDGTPSKFGSPIFQNAQYDVSDVIRNERNGRIIGYTFFDDMERTKYFDPALQHIQDLLESAYSGQSVEILSKDAAGKTFVIRTQGPHNPPVLSLFTTSNHQSNIIAEGYPDLKPTDLGEVKPYNYRSTDGFDIHAYLTLPPGRDPHNLPTVIFPHGGPEERDSMTFDWWAQFMASRGYVVLQPNFRGSTGYGFKFVKAGDGEWVGKVQDDVQAGVRKLIADGIADPKRICIVGASYGGYMALAGATFSPDLYACAISYAGVSDLDHLLYTGTTFESESISVWKRRIGTDVDDKKAAAASPANFANRVKIPIMLIHGDKDTTVPIKQSEIEADALKDAGKQVEFVTLQGDDHYLEYAPTRVQLLKEVERFLSSHIGN